MTLMDETAESLSGIPIYVSPPKTGCQRNDSAYVSMKDLIAWINLNQGWQKGGQYSY